MLCDEALCRSVLCAGPSAGTHALQTALSTGVGSFPFFGTQLVSFFARNRLEIICLHLS